MKQEYRVKLFGTVPGGKRAKTHQANQVDSFTNDKGTVTIVKQDEIYLMNTKRNTYNLSKHTLHNYYHCTANNIKVHFMPKKIVAELIYWK